MILVLNQSSICTISTVLWGRKNYNLGTTFLWNLAIPKLPPLACIYYCKVYIDCIPKKEKGSTATWKWMNVIHNGALVYLNSYNRISILLLFQKIFLECLMKLQRNDLIWLHKGFGTIVWKFSNLFSLVWIHIFIFPTFGGNCK